MFIFLLPYDFSFFFITITIIIILLFFSFILHFHSFLISFPLFSLFLCDEMGSFLGLTRNGIYSSCTCETMAVMMETGISGALSPLPPGCMLATVAGIQCRYDIVFARFSVVLSLGSLVWRVRGGVGAPSWRVTLGSTIGGGGEVVLSYFTTN